jgi:GT2 family glycosyltransferase
MSGRGSEGPSLSDPATVRASIVVVTFNHRAIVARCLSAAQSTMSAQDELIVVDNNSVDGTADEIARDFPEVQLIRSASNLGFGRANNLGASSARGRYVVFLNPDTEPQPGWLEALIGALTDYPGAALVTAKLVLAAAPGYVDAFGNDIHVSGITTCRGWGQPAERFTRVEEVNATSGACLAAERDVFQRLGGFDNYLFLYYEDTDLSLRARLAGYKCIAVPGAVVLHDHRPGFSPEKLRYLERNRWWSLLKLLRWRTLIALTPVLMLSEALAWGLAVLRGRRHVLAKAQAWMDLVRALPHLPRARADAARARVLSDVELLSAHASRVSFDQAARGPLIQLGEWVAATAFAGARLLVRASAGTLSAFLRSA